MIRIELGVVRKQRNSQERQLRSGFRFGVAGAAFSGGV